MGPLLAIDTSSATASVAVFDERVLAETTWRGGRHQSRALIEVIDRCLALAGVERTGLAGIVLASGPGSYSGLRVGASTAIGLSLSLGVEIVQVPTLEVIAVSLGCDAPLVRPAVEVGRGRFASALYRRSTRGLEQAGDIESIDAASLAVRAEAEDALLVGDFDPPMADQPQGEGLGGGRRPALGLRRAGVLAELGAQRLREGYAGDEVGQLIYLNS
jgi:tRNA threonylcarbamoyladenosine biosynthesis protein TsaB